MNSQDQWLSPSSIECSPWVPDCCSHTHIELSFKTAKAIKKDKFQIIAVQSATFMFQLLVTVVTPDMRLKYKVLQRVEESTYTRNKSQKVRQIFLKSSKLLRNNVSLCDPEFVPQIMGGAVLEGDDTVNWSVWH